MASMFDSCDYRYTITGSSTGLAFIAQVEHLLLQRGLPFVCDAPTCGTGNCLPFAVMQQLHQRDIYSSLSVEELRVSNNCHDLRVAVVNFVRNITPFSEYYSLIQESKTAICIVMNDDANNYLSKMERDKTWCDDQFLQFMSWFLERDIFLPLFDLHKEILWQPSC